MLAPLTDLVGECGETKTMKAKGTCKKPFYWSLVHQKAFDNVKATNVETVSKLLNRKDDGQSVRIEMINKAGEILRIII